jgi:hypothetical protein
MRAARKLGIEVAAVMLSWDNPTTRGYPGATADHIITWTDVMAKELVEHSDISADRITVCGIAHFDVYSRPDLAYNRDAFLRGLGLDPSKRVVLFVTKSPNGYAFNPNIAQILGDAIRERRLPADVQVLIRVHPIHYRFKAGQHVYADVLDMYQTIARQNSAVTVNEPVIMSDLLNSDMAENEMLFLARLVRSTDVVVNIFSTLNIEATLLDRPLVNVCFEGDKPLYKGRFGGRFDIGIDLRATHNQRILSSGGVKLVYSGDEMVAAVRAYLDDPSADREARQGIAEHEGGPNKGRAGIAVADKLIELAQSRRAP